MSEKETHIDQINRDAQFNEAGRDNVQAGRDAVAGNKTEIHNNFFANSPALDKPMSGELTYFLDRKKHRRLLRQAIQKHHDFKVPVVCIVFGEKENCGKDMFVSTIQPAISNDHPYGVFYKDAVHKPIPIQPANPVSSVGRVSTRQRVQVGINPDLRSKFRLFLNSNEHIGREKPQDATNLHEDIKAELNEKFSATTQKSVSEIIQELNAPVVMDTAISTRDYLRCDNENLIHGFLAFWQQWQAAPQQNHPILICLFIHLEPYKMTWLDRVRGKKDPNVTIKETLANLDFEQLGLHGVVLPEVGGISQEDIDEWASDFQILEKFGIGIHQGLKNEVGKCYAQQAEITLSKMSYFIYNHLSNPQSRKPT